MSAVPGAQGRRRTDRQRRRPRGPSPAFVAAATSRFVLAQAVAASTWWPIHESAELVVLVVVTLVVGALLGVLGALFRLSSAWLSAGTLVAFLLLGVPLAVPGSSVAGLLPTGRGLLELVQGTALGWKQLLTISLPVGSYQALLVPVFVLLLVGTVVGTSVALRTRRGEVAAVVPVVTWLAGIVLGPSVAVAPFVTSAGLLVVLVAWATWWRLRRRRLALDALVAGSEGVTTSSTGHGTAVVRAVAGGAATVLVAGAVAVGAATALPPAERRVARDVVEQPFDPRSEVSPLTRFRAYQQQPLLDDELFTVSGAPEGALLRLATLDSWDGVAWTVGSGEVDSASGFFTRVPSVVDRSGTRGRAVSIDVTVGDWASTWLPTVGRLEQVRFTSDDAQSLRDAFFYNDVSGTAAVLGGLHAGDAYRLDAVLPDAVDEERLARSSPGAASVPAPEGVPDQVRQAARAARAEADGDAGAALVAAVQRLRDEGYVSHGVGEDEPVSRQGHGADRIAQFFDDPVMLGDAEQYAAAAALVADELGFPSRVVMGFRPPEGGGRVPVTGADVTAWIEVDTAQDGWVAIDPNPEERPVPEDRVRDPSQVSRPESVVQPPPQDPQVRDAQSPPQDERDLPDPPPAWLAVLLAVARVAGWVLLVAAVLAAPFVAVIAVKARRRARRRRRPDPADRIAGGWQEFEDAVVDHGVEAPPAGTRQEVAATVGGSRPLVLARVADRAAFSPEPAAEEDADRVWTAVLDMRRALGRGLTRWQRLRAAVSTRSLRRYHGPTRPRR